MPFVKVRSVLKGILVKEAMRRHVLQLSGDASLDKCINRLIKFKANAIMVTDDSGRPAGVASKTDLISAYYGEMPIETPVAAIMNGPPLTCFPDDTLEDCLDVMRETRVHRLYVQGAEPCSVVGVLSYPDIVALLYRYCRACPHGTLRRPEKSTDAETDTPLVREIMSASVAHCRETEPLARVIEELVSHRLGAVLIQNEDGLARGVISKTDVILAYRHATGLETEARSIMRSPLVSCDRNAPLTDALRKMFLNDVQRLFVHEGDPGRVTGVLSLSDAAQARSGSCRACIASRIIGNS